MEPATGNTTMPPRRPMAIYHLTIKSVKRGDGQATTASAAYRTGERIHDARLDQTFDFTRRRGVLHSEIVLGSHAAGADWARDRVALWNAAEAAERRRDARSGREYEAALPHELNAVQRLDLARAYARMIAERYGCAVDIALHAPHVKGDTRNFHVHLLATTREVTPTGLGAKTAIELSDTDRRKRGLPTASEEITWLRNRWSELANEHLNAAGLAARIDARSLKDQGVARAPTEHLGPKLTAMQRRGRNTEVSWRVEQEATKRLGLAAEIGRLERERAEIERSILDVSSDLAAAKRLQALEYNARHPPAATTAQPADSRLDLSQDLAAAKASAPAIVAELAERTRARAVEVWLEWKRDPAHKSVERAKDKAESADTSRERKSDHDYGL
jgi:MobA/MobL family